MRAGAERARFCRARVLSWAARRLRVLRRRAVWARNPAPCSLGIATSHRAGRDRILGLAILRTFAGCLGFSLWARDAAIRSGPAGRPPTRELPASPATCARSMYCLWRRSSAFVRSSELRGSGREGRRHDGLHQEADGAPLLVPELARPRAAAQSHRWHAARSLLLWPPERSGWAVQAWPPRPIIQKCRAPDRSPRALPVIESCERARRLEVRHERAGRSEQREHGRDRVLFLGAPGPGVSVCRQGRQGQDAALHALGPRLQDRARRHLDQRGSVPPELPREGEPAQRVSSRFRSLALGDCRRLQGGRPLRRCRWLLQCLQPPQRRRRAARRSGRLAQRLPELHAANVFHGGESR